MRLIYAIREWAQRIKKDAVMLWFAYRDPRTPWLPKWVCLFAVTYALSPIDLIPDFIPVLGYVDDAILLPAAIWLASSLLPSEVISDSRRLAQEWLDTHGQKPVNRWGVLLVALFWGLLLLLTYWWLIDYVQ